MTLRLVPAGLLETSGIVGRLEASGLAGVLRTQGWVWPVLEMAHLVGLAALFGALLIVDLRVLGFAPAVPLDAAFRLIPLAIAGFGANVVTGSLLVLGDPAHFLHNDAFWFKLGLIGLAGCNALLFNLHRRLRPLAAGTSLGMAARVSAAVSLLAWAGVTAAARFIAYIESHHV